MGPSNKVDVVPPSLLPGTPVKFHGDLSSRIRLHRKTYGVLAVGNGLAECVDVQCVIGLYLSTLYGDRKTSLKPICIQAHSIAAAQYDIIKDITAAKFLFFCG